MSELPLSKTAHETSLGLIEHKGEENFADVQKRLRQHHERRAVGARLMMLVVVLTPLLGTMALHWRHAPKPVASLSTLATTRAESSALLPVANDEHTVIYWTLGDVHADKIERRNDESARESH